MSTLFDINPAFAFAAAAHEGQRYGEFPYIYHPHDAVRLLVQFHPHVRIEDPRGLARRAR